MRSLAIVLLSLAGCLEAPPAATVPEPPDAGVVPGLVAHDAMDDDPSRP